MKVLTVEAPKGYKKEKLETERSKIMYKYAQLKRFHPNQGIQVYMYDFMYADPEKMPAEDHFPDKKSFVVNYKKMSTP